jgi:chromosome partitioning protein
MHVMYTMRVPRMMSMVYRVSTTRTVLIPHMVYIIYMAVITMVQWKGGVGKSTLAVHLATALGGVLIDLEPWGGATNWWAGPHANDLWQAPGPAPVLRALERGKAPRPRRGEAGRPALVPSHEQLLSLTDGVASGVAAWAWTTEGVPALMVPTCDGPRRLADALRDAIPAWAEEWGNHVIVDTPAGFGPLADGAIAAADVVVLPVTLDQWAIPALRRFMRSYASRIRRGLVVPNRVRPRLVDGAWAEVIAGAGVVEPPFALGPPVEESEVLHGVRRPLTSGPTPGAARARALEQIDLVASRALELTA